MKTKSGLIDGLLKELILLESERFIAARLGSELSAATAKLLPSNLRLQLCVLVCGGA